MVALWASASADTHSRSRSSPARQSQSMPPATMDPAQRHRGTIRECSMHLFLLTAACRPTPSLQIPPEPRVCVGPSRPEAALSPQLFLRLSWP